MNENVVVKEGEEGTEVIDLGDAMAETRQPHWIVQVNDSMVTFTYFGLV